MKIKQKMKITVEMNNFEAMMIIRAMSRYLHPEVNGATYIDPDTQEMTAIVDLLQSKL